MNINRNNYEEFFILYWDNELTATQKQAVENFVKENTDLQQEFRIFGETRFGADNNIQLKEKEFLLNDSFINITNYEEQLLNYIDDELNIDQKAEVDKIAAQYPAVQKELALLQKTKIQPEAEIVFPDKSVLYRREEKVHVISIFWRRVAVAAAIILIAGLATLKLVTTNKGGSKIEVAKNNGSINIPTSNQSQNTKRDNHPTNLANVDEKKLITPQTDDKNKEKSIINKSTDRPDENSIAVNKIENKNNLPKEGKRPVQTTDELNTSEAIAAIDVNDVQKKSFDTPEKNKADAVNTSFDKSDVTLNATPTLYIPEPAEKEKGGLKEFLRKTTRVFERRTKIQTTTDDNKLLVGAFAVSLK